MMQHLKDSVEKEYGMVASEAHYAQDTEATIKPQKSNGEFSGVESSRTRRSVMQERLRKLNARFFIEKEEELGSNRQLQQMAEALTTNIGAHLRSNAIPFPFRNRGEETEQSRQGRGMQHKRPAALQPVVTKAPCTAGTPRCFVKSRGATLHSLALSPWTFANCKPVDYSCHSALGYGQALAGDANGTLLLASQTTGFCLLHFSPPSFRDRMDEAEWVHRQHERPYVCRDLLNITDVHSITKRCQGEVTIVEIGCEIVLLVGEPQDLEEGSPARIVAYSLDTPIRHAHNEPGVHLVGQPGPASIALGDITSWPRSRAEVTPSPRSYYSAAAYERARAIVLFGGACAPTGDDDLGARFCDGDWAFLPPTWYTLDDLWSFSIVSYQWTHYQRSATLSGSSATGRQGANEEDVLAVAWPPALAGHSAATWGKNMWVFGGYTRPCADGGMEAEGTASNDLWCGSLETCRWGKICPTGKAPQPRYRHSSCIVQGTLLVFGGIGAEGPVSPVETMYAVDVRSPQTAAWSRVTILDPLPTTGVYLGAAFCNAEGKSAGTGSFFLYGGRTAFLITANQLEQKAKLYPRRDRMWQRRAEAVEEDLPETSFPKAHTGEQQRQKFETTQRNQGSFQGSPKVNSAKLQEATVAWADVANLTAEEAPQATEEGEPKANNCLFDVRENSAGLRLVATPMCCDASHWPDTGSLMGTSHGGILPQVLESMQGAVEKEQQEGWQKAFAVKQTSSPIVFKARCRGRRHSSKGPREEFDSAQNASGPAVKAVTFQATLACQSSQQKYVTVEPLQIASPVDIQQSQGAKKETSAPLLQKGTAHSFSANPIAAAAVFGRDPKRPLSMQQRSILLSLSHQATLGSARYPSRRGTERWAGMNSSLNTPYWVGSSETAAHGCALLAGPLASMHPLLPDDTGLLCHTPHLHDVQHVVQPIKSLMYTTQPPASDSLIVDQAISKKQTQEVARLVSRQPLSVSKAGGKTLHPQLRRFGSLASALPYQPQAAPLHAAIPGHSQKCVESTDALMWWLSGSRAQGATPTTQATVGDASSDGRSQSGLSATNSNTNTASSDFDSAWATASNSRRSSDSDLTAMEKFSSSASCAHHASQETAQLLARVLYSSQTPAVPAQFAGCGRKTLPPLPSKLDAVGAPAKAMVARRVGPYVCAAAPIEEQAHGGLPLPRPARRLKTPHSSKINQESFSAKLKAKALPSTKVKQEEPKITVKSIKTKQRLPSGSTPTPRSGRTRSINQEHDATLSAAVRKDFMSSASVIRKASILKPETVLKPKAPLAQSANEKFLRKIMGWPREAIANFMMVKAATDVETTKKTKNSGVKPRALIKK